MASMYLSGFSIGVYQVHGLLSSIRSRQTVPRLHVCTHCLSRGILRRCTSDVPSHAVLMSRCSLFRFTNVRQKKKTDRKGIKDEDEVYDVSIIDGKLRCDTPNCKYSAQLPFAVTMVALLPQCLSTYPCGHGSVFTLPSRQFPSRNFRHPARGPVVRSLAHAILPRLPSSLPSRALCLVKKKNQIATSQLQVTMTKYKTLNRIQVSDEQEMTEPDTYLYKLINITSSRGTFSQMYSFTSAIKQYMVLILAAETQDFGTDFHSRQTALQEIRNTRVKLQQLQCSLYLVLKKGGAKSITSSEVTVPKEDVMFYRGSPGRADRFRRDFQIFVSANKLLEMAGGKINSTIQGNCP